MKHSKSKIFICIVLAIFGMAHPRVRSADCERRSICSDCIQTKGCSWCTKVKKSSGSKWSSGCFSTEKTRLVCDGFKYIENPRSAVKIISSRPMNNGKTGESVQIRPQEIAIKARPGDPITIDVEFEKAEDYPIDLYYLMDFSSSMYKYKKNLAKLGNKIAETMLNLTTDFQLGFGTFVDKVTLPFTSTRPSHLSRPCPGCRSPYSYRNHMSLSKETNRFSVEVEKAEMSGNIDTPEGVFDGLMQTMVCQKELNWREKARHIIVVSTDAPFHLAGDGKLGGVVEPNDELCHLDEQGYYTHSLQFDYPSVSQINYQSVENNMNIIFAVVNKVRQEYQLLAREIQGASWGLLDAGENIADLIRAQYEKISSTIKLTENSRGPVTISFSSKCGPEEKWRNTDECDGVKGGTLIQFRIHLLVSDCAAKEFRSQKISVKPEGINETLTIDLTTICDCDCSSGNEKDSEQCSRAGNLVCGQCICHKGRIGEKCECKGDDEEILSITDTTHCVTNNATNELCSGRGDCKCGVCQCHRGKASGEEYSGKYCECDDFSCRRVNGVLCGEHGTCKCGQCHCQTGWTGEKCDCFSGDEICKEKPEDIPCSGKGTCFCGMCFCNNGTEADEHRYSGKYCQNCMTCKEKCEEYSACVKCISHTGDPITGNQCQNCSDKYYVILIDTLDGIRQNITGKLCTGADDNGCTFGYIYDYNEKNDLVTIWVEKAISCPRQVNLLAAIGGTISGTVLIGILSLIAWKIITDFYDKREYEKFERERNLARWGQEDNPLYKTATKTYENPTYVRSETTDSGKAASI